MAAVSTGLPTSGLLRFLCLFVVRTFWTTNACWRTIPILAFNMANRFLILQVYENIITNFEKFKTLSIMNNE